MKPWLVAAIWLAVVAASASCDTSRMSEQECEIAHDRLSDFDTCLHNDHCKITADDIRSIRLYREAADLCEKQKER